MWPPLTAYRTAAACPLHAAVILELPPGTGVTATPPGYPLCAPRRQAQSPRCCICPLDVRVNHLQSDFRGDPSLPVCAGLCRVTSGTAV
ncbi:hypothetical protein FKM82_026162 [Ascaphus truei]